MSITADRIRNLFLHGKETYTIAEAAGLLGMTEPVVHEWLASGELEPVDTPQGLAIPWSELVSFGIAFWPQEKVEEALGADIYDVLPELLRLAELEVRIPRIEVVTLERLAARDHASVSDVLARELRDLVSEHSEWLSREVSGFAEALAWPEQTVVPPPPRRGSSGVPQTIRWSPPEVQPLKFVVQPLTS